MCDVVSKYLSMHVKRTKHKTEKQNLLKCTAGHTLMSLTCCSVSRTILQVKAFVLEPGPRADDATKEGIIDVDGEVLARGKATYKSDQKALMAYDKLQITVDQGLATVFTPL